MKKTTYARSLGPSQLAHALKDRGSLLARQQPVTFLMELTPEDDPALCDAWDYGQGRSLGIFAFPAADDITVWRDAREEQDRHNPHQHPYHVWIDNSQQNLPFERGVFVESPQELGAILTADSVQEAKDRLHTLRDGRSEDATLEAALLRAQQAVTRCQTLRDTITSLQQLSQDRLHDALARYGLPPWLLDVDPEHLSDVLMDPLERVAAALGVQK